MSLTMVHSREILLDVYDKIRTLYQEGNVIQGGYRDRYLPSATGLAIQNRLLAEMTPSFFGKDICAKDSWEEIASKVLFWLCELVTLNTCFQTLDRGVCLCVVLKEAELCWVDEVRIKKQRGDLDPDNQGLYNLLFDGFKGSPWHTIEQLEQLLILLHTFYRKHGDTREPITTNGYKHYFSVIIEGVGVKDPSGKGFAFEC